MESLETKTPVCSDCVHYLKHFGLGKAGLFEVNCGHCLLKKSKSNFRQANKICDKFEVLTPEIKLERILKLVKSRVKNININSEFLEFYISFLSDIDK